MDMRYKAFLVHEADAIHRQEMARLAQAVAAGFSDKAGFSKFIAGLELYESKAATRGDEALVDEALSLLRGLRR